VISAGALQKGDELLSCSTCDGYEFVPNPDDPDGEKLDCPDCRAIDPRPLVWCPTHSTHVEIDGRCRKCRLEAANAEEVLLARARAAKAVLTAATPRGRQIARDLVVRARLAEGLVT
jgi:hypothetical protein